MPEKMLAFLYDEIPHGTAVTVERLQECPGGRMLADIDINIYCEKKSHKGIIIGKGGAMLKKIASAARLESQGVSGRAGEPAVLGEDRDAAIGAIIICF